LFCPAIKLLSKLNELNHLNGLNVLNEFLCTHTTLCDYDFRKAGGA
jgi:hypothetical protein